MTAAWRRCAICPDWICALHGRHAHDCGCPPIERWAIDPYTEGGPMPDQPSARIILEVLSTNQTVFPERAGIHVTLNGTLDGDPETLVALMRARQRGRPIVRVTIEAIATDEDEEGAP